MRLVLPQFGGLLGDGIEGISILTIVDEGGTLKVARDVFVGFEVK
jgi:hypothetical protein